MTRIRGAMESVSSIPSTSWNLATNLSPDFGRSLCVGLTAEIRLQESSFDS